MRFFSLSLFVLAMLSPACSEVSTQKEIANFDQTGNALLAISGCERQVNKFVEVSIPSEQLSSSQVHDACHTSQFRIPGTEENAKVFVSVDVEGHIIAMGISYNLEKQMDGASEKLIADKFWKQKDKAGCDMRQRTAQRVFCYAQAAARTFKNYLEARAERQKTTSLP